METVLVQIENTKAYQLLQDLEDLKIIKVLKKTKQKEQDDGYKSNTARFRGALKLSNEQYRNFQQHTKDIRNEWRGSI